MTQVVEAPAQSALHGKNGAATPGTEESSVRSSRKCPPVGIEPDGIVMLGVPSVELSEQKRLFLAQVKQFSGHRILDDTTFPELEKIQGTYEKICSTKRRNIIFAHHE